MPASLEIPADSRPSRIAAASNDDSTLSLAPSANCASASDRASPILRSALRSLRCTTDSSIILAMKTVQVTSEAKASPIITALTRMSADRNIDHGDSSRSPVDFRGLASADGCRAAASDAADDRRRNDRRRRWSLHRRSGLHGNGCGLRGRLLRCRGRIRLLRGRWRHQQQHSERADHGIRRSREKTVHISVQ